jgi:hypothetical protein
MLWGEVDANNPGERQQYFFPSPACREKERYAATEVTFSPLVTRFRPARLEM